MGEGSNLAETISHVVLVDHVQLRGLCTFEYLDVTPERLAISQNDVIVLRRFRLRQHNARHEKQEQNNASEYHIVPPSKKRSCSISQGPSGELLNQASQTP